MTRYNGLKIREATPEETEHGKWAWGANYSGWVAERPGVGTFMVLRGEKRWTPHGTYRINKNHTELIHAAYAQYDKIILRDGVAVDEVLDVDDRF